MCVVQVVVVGTWWCVLRSTQRTSVALKRLGACVCDTEQWGASTARVEEPSPSVPCRSCPSKHLRLPRRYTLDVRHHDHDHPNNDSSSIRRALCPLHPPAVAVSAACSYSCCVCVGRLRTAVYSPAPPPPTACAQARACPRLPRSSSVSVSVSWLGAPDRPALPRLLPPLSSSSCKRLLFGVGGRQQEDGEERLPHPQGGACPVRGRADDVPCRAGVCGVLMDGPLAGHHP